uniref:Reverse transcriptase domain-containing protein n=1 Tax=Photinus pyralis TaxID=7054 RepID=A0A1Y1L1T2_PHOPY
MRVPKEHPWSESETNLIKIEINHLLDIGAISKCHPCKDQFISDIFLVQKPGGKFRLVMNLKKFNTFLSTSHFKLEDRRTVTKLLSKDCYMATLDLKEAYYSVKIHSNSKKYLRFYFQNQLYEYNCLCFGVSVAPFVFTKILKPVVAKLRSKGLLSVVYLDDFIVFADSYTLCMENLKQTTNLLTKLGFVVNDKKSTSPSKICTFLGFCFNSEKMLLYLPKSKHLKTISLCSRLISLSRCSIHFLAQVIGFLVSVCPATQYGWLYLKQLERAKCLALHKSGGSYKTIISIQRNLKLDLQWWLDNICYSQKDLKMKPYMLTIYSDSSLKGWGSVCGKETIAGQWSATEREYHINYLELKAAFLGLKYFASDLQGINILLRIDNITAIAYINRMGGTRHPHLNSLAREIWQWCEIRRLWIFASYIESKNNKEADTESRRIVKETEWELNMTYYNQIISKLGKPTLDLFASRTNFKCSRYVSWKNDPDALAVDAFTLDWTEEFFYAFPPFILILPVLKKIIEERATGIVVVPYWVMQPWFPLFKKLACSNWIILPPKIDLLLSVDRRPHRLWQQTSLVAAILSGKRFTEKE